jgi:amino acid transporter
LGADGLSSTSYGPEEAFRTLGQHTYLAALLALVVAATVCIISAAYSRIIEDFPSGGGGYVVATKLLGSRAGVVSGCALLVDYVLTITVSIAAAGDAIFSFLPLHWHALKIPIEIALIGTLTTINIRGVRESVILLTPIFLLFLLTHLFLVLGIGFIHLDSIPERVHDFRTQWNHDLNTIGGWGMLLLFVHAYSLGGGTYTGIEAVSNGVPLMREPHVQTAKRTMVYMATSLAFFASGLLFCYLLANVVPTPGRTLNFKRRRLNGCGLARSTTLYPRQCAEARYHV